MTHVYITLTMTVIEFDIVKAVNYELSGQKSLVNKNIYGAILSPKRTETVENTWELCLHDVVYKMTDI